MEKLIEPKVLKGFRDFLPEKEIERKRIQKILEKTFESHGFVPIDTPVLEYTEVLLGKGGGETDKQIYHFLDNGERDVAMRFDLTVPFARFMAAHEAELYLPFKRYHIAKVYRGENTQKGRYREFTQCDFDIVGADTVHADFEILELMYRSFEALGIDAFSIEISHRGIFNAFLGKIGMDERSGDVLRTVDKLAKAGKEAVIDMLAELSSRENAAKIIEYITAEGGYIETLAKMETLSGGETEGSARLKALYAMLTETGIASHFRLNPSITRGLDYYTGIVFETFLAGLPAIGSVCSGGRYNNLASLYTRTQLPGVGSSIGLDRLMAALEEIEKRTDRKSHTKLIVLNMDESLGGYYFTLASLFRREGIPCEVYLDKKKIGVSSPSPRRRGYPSPWCAERMRGSGGSSR
jgi:histidyl-tRNA synthetase